MKLTTILEQINQKKILTEDLHSSQVIAHSIYNNIDKLSKRGGKIGMSIKSNKTTTAQIIFRTLLDPKTNKFLKGNFDEHPNADLLYFVAVFNNKNDTWKVSDIEGNFKKIGVDLKDGKYSDEDLAKIFNNIFKAYK